METASFYHDDPRSQFTNMDTVKKLKSTMTLDFDGLNKPKNSCLSSVMKAKFLLASPDMKLLKLGSPELEKMLIQQNGNITTTPTPTQFIFPRSVTEEQEAYARGFVDALEELHKQQGVPYNGNDDDPIDVDTDDDQITYTSLLVRAPGKQNDPRLPLSMEQDSLQNHDLHSRQTNIPMLLHLKEEPQTVPCMGETPPMSPIMPINMDNQERIKLDRKRARNRVAARKCRTRKLERISRLEERVDELKTHNTGLSDTASTLRDQVCRLKQQIMEHVQNGCQMMDSHTAGLL